MTGPLAVPATRLVARTRSAHPALDPLDAVTPDAFVWFTPAGALVASGVAARVRIDDVDALLSSIEIDDDVGAPGAGAIACGALPFDLDGAAELVVPARVVGRAPDGRVWATDIVEPGPPADEPLQTNGVARPNVVAIAQERARRTGEGTSGDEWARAVRRALAAIDTGELAKVVLARHLVVEAREPLDVGSILARLRAEQRGCFVFAHGGIVGASPELLVARRGSRATSRPMAGTACAADDASLAALTASAKDTVEHRAVVDAVTAALAASAVEAPTVRGPDAVRVGGLAHLATTVEARLDDRDPPSALSLARRLHPTPAVGGVPVGAALRLIGDVEPVERGRYAGPVGWVDASGDGEWAVALRCAEVSGARAVLYAGAGVVAGSDPAAEWRETEAKLVPMLSALGVATES